MRKMFRGRGRELKREKQRLGEREVEGEKEREKLRIYEKEVDGERERARDREWVTKRLGGGEGKRE